MKKLSTGQNFLEIKNFSKIYEQELSQIKKEIPKNLKKIEENIAIEKQIDALNTKDFQKISSIKRLSKDQTKVINKIFNESYEDYLLQLKTMRSAEDLTIGYCFLRAMHIHHMLLRNNIAQEQIVKIFALGDLNLMEIFWQYHVAIGVIDSDGNLKIIDPMAAKLVSMEEWIKLVKSFSIKNPVSHIRFYVSDPRQFMPNGEMYSLDILENQYYQNYFKNF